MEKDKSTVKTIRKDKKLDKRLKRHFKEDLQFNHLTQSSPDANGLDDDENKPLMTEQPDGDDRDKQRMTRDDLECLDYKKTEKTIAKPHFSSEHSEYDCDNEYDGGSKGGQVEHAIKDTCCYCIPIKCALIIFSVLVIVDFVFEVWDTYELLDNSQFDTWYADIQAAMLVIYFIGVVLIICYYCAPDSPKMRNIFSYSFLIAGLVNLLFATWLIIYILGLYKKDWVYVQRYNSNSNVDESDIHEHGLSLKYKRVSKVEYVLTHLISPLLDGICFLCVYCTAADWVEKHKGMEKACC